MPKFLFWNLNNKPLETIIARLALAQDVDLLMFAECNIDSVTMLNALNTGEQANYHYAPSRQCKKIHLYTRFEDRFLPIVLETARLTIRHLVLPNSPEILLAVVHFISKLQYSVQSQEEEAHELALDIIRAEEIVGHRRTVLCGDLNMNPFEYGVVGAGTLNATMSRDIASRPDRIIQHRTYRYFYNPMWAHFGDANDTAPGTLYYPKSDHLCYFWNMFDQILLRPDLLSMWNADKLKILRGVGQQVFLSDTDNVLEDEISDHLPIVFELDFAA